MSTAYDGAVRIDPHEGSGTLLLAFSGKRKDPKAPGYNFQRMTSELPVSKIFVRDMYNLWYHGFHPDVGWGVDALLAYLRKEIAALGPRRIVAAGGSMGGYAAVLFGNLLAVDHVLAITPQSFIDPTNRRRALDFRYADLIAQVHVHPTAMPTYFDLAEVVEGAKPGTVTEIHYGWDRLDRAHARHLAGARGVHLVKHGTHRHDLAPVLKRRGYLKQALEHALGITQGPRPPAIPTGSPLRAVRAFVKGGFSFR